MRERSPPPDLSLALALVLAVAGRVDTVVDAAMEAAFPEHFGSWVELTTGEGERRRAGVLDSLGTPARPIPAEGWSPSSTS